MKILFKIVIVILFAVPVFANEKDIAIRFVESIDAEKAFEYQFFTIARRTVTIQWLIRDHGEDNVNAEIMTQIKRILPKYIDELQNNLGSIYLKYFKVEELQSLMNSKRQSEHFKKLSTLQNKIGGEMFEMSKPIIQKITEEVMMNVLKKYSS